MAGGEIGQDHSHIGLSWSRSVLTDPVPGSWGIFAAIWAIVLAAAQVSELQKHRLKPVVVWLLDLPGRAMALRRDATAAR